MLALDVFLLVAFVPEPFVADTDLLGADFFCARFFRAGFADLPEDFCFRAGFFFVCTFARVFWDLFVDFFLVAIAEV